MSIERDKRAKELFADALEKAEAAERAAWLAQACGDDVELRQEVETLLQAHQASGAFLEEPAGGVRKVGSAKPSGTIVLSTPLTEKPGDKIGHYKLLEQIGEGGCGVVYMAEQQEPIRRKVAFKVIKLGMDTKQVIARFEAERQALALMDHPNIAKVLDAGATETGRPYFVMELVRGQRITQYCDENNLPTEARLDLFMQVCHAIQHAHQKGIIHRDIKPSNILVTVVDGWPVPKVIDFGIAKAIGQQLTEKTVFTSFEQFIGTPAYMSPEQAQLSGVDVDTRSDIYSLGVLLYELLTGHTPFDPKTLLSAGLDEMRRMIREKEPARPSTRLSSLDASEQTTVAKRRQSEPPRLIHQVRGDLDWIVMKCLEKNRARRYETAVGVAADLERHLKHEPVTAAAPSAGYRARKFMCRHKTGLGMGAALVLLLMAGVVVSTWQAVRATRAEQAQSVLRQQAEQARANETRLRRQAEANEQKAETEATKSQQVARFLQEMLRSVEPSVALGRDATMLREILDKTAARVGMDLTSQPEVEAELRSTLGYTYKELGDYRKAVEMHRQAVRLRKAVYGEAHELVAASLNDLGDALTEAGDPKEVSEAESILREALKIRQQLPGNREIDVGRSRVSLALALGAAGKPREAETLLRQVLRDLKALVPAGNKDTAELLNSLGGLLRGQGRLDEAEAVNREALAVARTVFGNESPEMASALAKLGYVLLTQGRLTEAEPLLREGYEKRKRFLGADHNYAASTFSALYLVLLRQGKVEETEQIVRDNLAMRRQRVPDAELGFALDRLSLVLRVKGELSEAKSAQQEALKVWADLADRVTANQLNEVAWGIACAQDTTPAEARLAVDLAEKAVAATNRKAAGMLDTLAAAYARLGQFDKAVAVQQEAIGQLQDEAQKNAFTSRLKLYQTHQPHTGELEYANMLAPYASRLLSEGKFTEAESPARRCLAIRERDYPDDWRTFNSRSTLGGTLLGQEKYAEAEPLLLSGYEGMKQREAKIPAAGKLRPKEALQRVVQLYEETDRPDQAAQWKQRLAELDRPAK